ncbi:MAG TPA: DUF1016 domain-containing protein [Deltaproteobacteria bacterium]|nr:MAG: hypothetical protein A2048_01245 [Deltaproteobacteria bacterium GWA2_45_12]HBF11820.1 DUF1016 domain-containing protein [Deltaproteobacteria bacterium]
MRKKNTTLTVKKDAQILRQGFYSQVRGVIHDARGKAYRAVNLIMVEAYWNVGRLILEEEQHGKKRADYGSFLIGSLAKRLTQEFGQGFDERNLWYMRSFYEGFPILNALRSELSWTHYRLLLRVENKQARAWYMNEAAEGHWSTRQLERQINALYYERLLASKNKKSVRKEASGKLAQVEPEQFIRDPYVLEFLNLKDYPGLREAELEKAIIDNLQNFLLELGKGFSFVARQKRMRFEDENFYVDLVFYNYILKCFVLIDLKIGKLTHQDIGQMDSYVRMFEQHCRGEQDNPTIGLILCSKKNEAVAKYSVLQDSKQIFASKYKLYLPTEQEWIEELEHERELIEQKQKLLKGD